MKSTLETDGLGLFAEQRRVSRPCSGFSGIAQSDETYSSHLLAFGQQELLRGHAAWSGVGPVFGGQWIRLQRGPAGSSLTPRLHLRRELLFRKNV